MASMSGSEQDVEEQWDDMAIVRAFEEALTDQRAKASAPVKTSRKHKAARSNGRKARSVSVEEEEESEPAEAFTAGAAWGQAAQPTAATGAASFANQQSPNDLYQAAYAQAYAQLQAQFQAAYPAGPQASSQFAAASPAYGTQIPPYPTQPSYFMPPGMPSTPTMPSMQMPFPAMPGAAPFPGMSSNTSDDGLANLLLAWYQSGYYTGRFQAMQEMKMRGHR